MASLYRRSNSPFWWIKFRDPITGITKRESTGHKIGVGPDTRRAEQMRAEKTLAESKMQAVNLDERWEHWIGDYIALRYAGAGRTLERYQTAWRTLKMFLTENGITMPRLWRREHCGQYMAWRQKHDKKNGKYRAGHNTALLELKFMRLIMDEAVRREYAPFNPCHGMQIKKVAGKVKPELTVDAIEKIRAAIQTEPEPLRTFFNNSFEISYYHGVRLSETWLNPMKDVQFTAPDRAKVTFKVKRGDLHTVFLHKQLVPLFKQLIEHGCKETYARPRGPSREWFRFLNRHGIKDILPNVCFHSLRVTVATKLARAGVSEKRAMEYINHASTTVHRSYVRLRAEDLEECSDAIS